MDISVSSDNTVTNRHKERVECLLNKENFKLKSISDKWFIGTSDSHTDRVYMVDKNTKQEYSICFFDKKYGYEYKVFKREPLPDYVYDKMIKQRPEYKTGVTEIDNGNIEIFIPRRKNLFEEIIEQQKLEDKIFNSGLFILNVTSMDDIDNNSIQVINGIHKCIIIKMMTKSDIDATVTHFNILREKFPDIEVFTLKCNSSKAIISDAYDYLENKGYNIETGVKPVSL